MPLGTKREGHRGSSESLADGVMEGGAECFDELGVAVWPCAIGEQNDGDLCIEVNP